MNVDPNPHLSPKFTAGVQLLGRTGARAFELRYCGGGDDAEQPPVAWVAVVVHATGWDCAAASDPERAVLRLCERVIDGGTCTHCHRPTGFDEDFDDTLNEAMSAGQVCWYLWDPELATFRRGCE